MVVRVEPLLHRESLNIALLTLIASCERKVCLKFRKAKILVSLRDNVEQKCRIKNVVVEGEIV